MWRKLTDKERLRLIYAYEASAKKEKCLLGLIMYALSCIVVILSYDAICYTAFTLWNLSVIFGTLFAMAILYSIAVLYLFAEKISLKKNYTRICETKVLDKRHINNCYEVLVDITEYNVTHRYWVKIHKNLYEKLSKYIQVSVIQFKEGHYSNMIALDKDLDYIYID